MNVVAVLNKKFSQLNLWIWMFQRINTKGSSLVCFLDWWSASLHIAGVLNRLIHAYCTVPARIEIQRVPSLCSRWFRSTTVILTVSSSCFEWIDTLQLHHLCSNHGAICFLIEEDVGYHRVMLWILCVSCVLNRMTPLYLTVWARIEVLTVLLLGHVSVIVG